MHWEEAILQSQFISRRQLAYVAVILFVLPILGFTGFDVFPKHILILILLLWPIATYCLYARYQLNPNHAQNPIQILRFVPESIVWIYQYANQTNPFALQIFNRFTIVICTLNGETYAINFTESSCLKAVMDHIMDVCPRASKGYSADKHALFKLHPENLLDYK